MRAIDKAALTGAARLIRHKAALFQNVSNANFRPAFSDNA